MIKGDTVYDKKTDLTWQRCSVGQRWVDGTGCVGEIKLFNYVDSQRQGDATWRVPTFDELATLIDNGRAGRRQPTIDWVAFPNTPALGYWTSTPYGPLGWATNFDGGRDHSAYFRSDTNAVRLVRGGQ